MSYTVKEIFVSLQGEGFHSGRKAVFVRFAGCNLWSGREADRGPSCSAWCDTDFVGGTRMTAPAIARTVAELWGSDRRHRWAVLTGGEPTLQADAVLIAALRRSGFGVAVETNGTNPLPPDVDWVTLSPKAGVALYLTSASELKVVWPQAGLDPESLARFPASHRYLQPRDGPGREANMRATVAYCLDHPEWRLSLQTQKWIGLP